MEQFVEAISIMLEKKKLDPIVYEFVSTMNKGADMKRYAQFEKIFELERLRNSKMITLSGGELQRVSCALIASFKANVYVFDEPSSFLDVKQRLQMAKVIRSLADEGHYVLIVEHDISILDYTADFICIMYGVPGAYGVVSTPSTTARGINQFFKGYIPPDNMRFRTEPYYFTNPVSEVVEIEYDKGDFEYPEAVVKHDKFNLLIKTGKIKKGDGIVVLLGKNGTGKTTFLKQLATSLELSVSVKTQQHRIKRYMLKNGTYPTVEQLFNLLIRSKFHNPMFQSDVVEPLKVKRLLTNKVDTLSGGELQRVAIILALGKEADVYLLDEPSAFLDVEQRAALVKVLKRFFSHNQKNCFIVEHDTTMATSLASENSSRIVVLEEVETEGDVRHAIANPPKGFEEGMNKFLKMMNITFCQDATYGRPRINKLNSNRDREQKKAGLFYTSK